MLHKGLRPVHRGIVQQDRASLGNLGTQWIAARSHDSRIDPSFDHVRVKVLVTLQNTEDIQTPTMA
jgi:hypothetical protein